jgi:hypothetical protein
MSDTAMDTPEATEIIQNLRPNLKLRQPDLYSGERDKLETWILQFDRHFHIEGDNVVDEDKVTLASTFMRGDAEKWVLPIIKRYMDPAVHDQDNKNLVEDWDLFKARLREIFSPSAEVTLAEQKIQNLRQTRSAADYTTQFQQYAELVQWDDNALKRMYKQGLKPAVRAELMRTGVSITNIQSLYKEAIRLDNQIYELALEERSYGTRPPRANNEPKYLGRKPQPNHGRQRQTYAPRRNQGYYAPGGVVAMEIDNLVQGKHIPTTQDKRRNSTPKKEITCYACNKKGHMARDCRLKNKVTRQLNMLTNDEETAEEWTVLHPAYSATSPNGEWIPEDTTTIHEEGQVLTDTRPTLEEWNLVANHISQNLGKDMDPAKIHRDGQILREAGRRNAHATERTIQFLEYQITQGNVRPEEIANIQRQKERLRQTQKTQEVLDQARRSKYEDESWDTLAEYVKETIRKGIVMKNTTTTFEGSGWEKLNHLTINPDSKEKSSDNDTEPHPGHRIHGSWDQELDNEDHNPDERALTPEELAVDTPPASPKLVRQHATLGQEELRQRRRQEGIRHYCRPHLKKTCRKRQKEDALLNEEQALHVYEEPSWVDNAEEAYRQKNYEYATISHDTKYLVDPRNPKHGYLHWTACPHDSCHVHYGGKVEGHFPCHDYRKSCKWTAHDCPKVTCAEHLYDKRVYLNCFPTHSETDNTQYHLAVNNRCFNRDWRVCLVETCEIHYQAKLANGYAKENPFLERTPAALEAATRSTLKNLSNSQ